MARHQRNFRSPSYIANSVQDFWRRSSHISLSTGFAKLYVPLGGGHASARVGPTASPCSCCAVCGRGELELRRLGLFHGMFLIVERRVPGASQFRFPRRTSGVPPRRIDAPPRCTSMLVVMVGWVLFRAAPCPEPWGFSRRHGRSRPVVADPDRGFLVPDAGAPGWRSPPASSVRRRPSLGSCGCATSDAAARPGGLTSRRRAVYHSRGINPPDGGAQLQPFHLLSILMGRRANAIRDLSGSLSASSRCRSPARSPASTARIRPRRIARWPAFLPSKGAGGLRFGYPSSLRAVVSTITSRWVAPGPIGRGDRSSTSTRRHRQASCVGARLARSMRTMARSRTSRALRR